MRVLVAGASGYIGRHVVAELVRRGHQVVVLLRRAPDANLASFLDGARPCLTPTLGDAALAASAGRIGSVDAVVSCIAASSGRPAEAWAVDHDMNQALLRLATRLGARHFQLLSALCVQRPVLAFQRAKHAFEQALADASIDHSIIRPTAFFKSLAGQIERIRHNKPFLLFGQGPGPACVPISETDLAGFMADVLADDRRWNRTLATGGPGPAVTPHERGEMLFALAGKPSRFRRIPLSLVRSVGCGLAGAGRVSRRAADGAEFARIAYFYATEPMLVADPKSGQPSAAATPRCGRDTLAEFYARTWRKGLDGQRLGDAALFERRS